MWSFSFGPYSVIVNAMTGKARVTLRIQSVAGEDFRHRILDTVPGSAPLYGEAGGVVLVSHEGNDNDFECDNDLKCWEPKYRAPFQSLAFCLVGDDDVNQVLRGLPGWCPQLEAQSKFLEEHLPQGRRILVEIAGSTYRPPGVTISNQAIQDWLAGIPKLNRHLTVRGSYVCIEDPVLRRYVGLTRGA